MRRCFGTEFEQMEHVESDFTDFTNLFVLGSVLEKFEFENLSS